MARSPARRVTERSDLVTSAVDPDEDLVRRAGHGDPAAIQALVARKLPRMLALATRMLGDEAEAEDVAQEAMLRAWKQVPRWTFGKARFDTWLHRVGLNLCYDRLRKRREVVMAEPPDQIDDAPTPEAAMAQQEAQQDLTLRIRAALDALPQRQREAIVLCHYQGLSNIEAAELMDVSVDALESLLARGRRGLRERLAPLVAEVSAKDC